MFNLFDPTRFHFKNLDLRRIEISLLPDRCSRWQRLLTRRADGKIPAAQWGLLQDHLASCARCRAAAHADDSLHTALGLREPTMTPGTARAFDDRVLAALSGTRRPEPAFARLRTRCRHTWATRLPAVSVDFLAQLGGGAVVATGLTCLFLLSALHSQSPRSTRAALTEDRQARQTLQRSVLPVPLESLLNTPSPRAAMLWTRPARAAGRSAHAPFRSLSAPVLDETLPSRSLPQHARPADPTDLPARPAAEQRGEQAAHETFG